MHSRIGIGRKKNRRTVGRLTCIETELEVHKRQRFNRPVAAIKCVHSTLEKFLDQTTFTTPAIIWFDYTAPKGIASQIQRFAATVGTVPVGSVLRVTLNANPTSLGSGGEEPSGKDLSVEVDGEVSADRAQKPTKAEWRLEQFKQRLGTLVPAGLTADGMTHKKYGPSLLQVLKLAVEKQALSFTDRQIVWGLATHYADDQPMVTAALIVVPREDTVTEKLVKGWEFYSTPDGHQSSFPRCLLWNGSRWSGTTMRTKSSGSTSRRSSSRSWVSTPSTCSRNSTGCTRTSAGGAVKRWRATRDDDHRIERTGMARQGGDVARPARRSA